MAEPEPQAPIGALDDLQQGPGFIVIRGWVGVPGSITLDLGGVTHPVRHLFPRADLPHPERFRAFREDIPWDGPPPPLVTLVADGIALARSAPAPWPPFTPIGAIEVFSEAQLSGWVYDPAQWFGLPDLCLCADGVPVLDVPLSETRTDLPMGARLRGERLGFYLPAARLGPALDALRPFGDGVTRAWTLRCRGVTLAERVLMLPALAQGRLLDWSGGALEGEARLQADRPPMVQVSLDGRPFALLATHQGRFTLPLPHSPTGRASVTAAARIAGQAQPLPGSAQVLRHLPLARGVGAEAARALARGRPRVAIIIPIHNAAEALRECLASVFAHSAAPARLILVNDASTDAAIAEILAEAATRRGVEIISHATNRGFTASCNTGIAAAGRDDVVLLNSDTVVPARWLENLMAAAHSSPETASATPFSDRAGAFTAHDLPAGFSATDLARGCAQASLAEPPETPTGHGFCLYLRRDALDRVGLLDAEGFPRGYGEENEWSVRALRAGMRHVVDDRTLVLHREGESFGTERAALLADGRARVDARFPEYPALVHGFLNDPVMQAARWRIAGGFGEAPPRPRILFVISIDSGGTPLTNADLMRALEDRYEPWLLQSDPRGLTLSRLRDGALEPVETVALNRPIRLADHSSAEYDRALAGLLLRHAIEIVHVRHMAWHGLGLPLVARALGIPVVMSLHDHFAICPSLKLLDAEGRHCAGRCTEGPGACHAELYPPAEVPALRNSYVHRWREVMEPALAAADALVTTSPSARALHLAAFPSLAGREFRIIPHGRDFGALRPGRHPATGPGPLRVLLPGHITHAKGHGLLAAMAALDQGRRVEFHVLGTAVGLVETPGLRLHGPYARADFAARAEAIAPHLGAVLSVWPETWCHTLTELWSIGLPVLGVDLGAVGERIRAHGGGWLMPPDATPEALLERIAALARDAPGLSRKRLEVRRWQRGEGNARDTAAMAADYDRLYRDLRHRGLAFGAAAPTPVWLRLDLREVAGQPIPRGFANEAAAPRIHRPVRPDQLAAALAGDVAGVGVLCDHLASPALAQVLPLLRDHACRIGPTVAAEDDLADPAPGWRLVLPGEV